MTIFNTIGLAKSGDMKDFYIKVVDDTSESGEFYILFSTNFRDPSAEGYDEIYFDIKDVYNRLNELNVLWLLEKEGKNDN